MAAAGAAIAFSATEPSSALEIVRLTLGISPWENEGITGNGAIVADFSGLPPLISGASNNPIVKTHKLLIRSNPIPIVFEGDGIPRLSFASLLEHDHQTATAGAMVASGNGNSQPEGLVPNAQLLVGWFGIEKNPQGGFDSGIFAPASGGGQFDAMIWTLLAMTDQDIANAVVANDNAIPNTPYTVATVVNASLGRGSNNSRRGEDEDARIFNIVATMTGATLVAPTSNFGHLDDDDMGDDPALSDLGRIYSPGSAHNVISVGAISRDLTTVLDKSGKGPMQGQNYADVAALYDDSVMTFVNPFTPEGGGELESNSGIFRTVRAGVDIVAPGDQLNLPGTVVGSGLSTTRTSRLWTGTSFSSAIVAGAVGLMHELGEREGYSIHNVVTRAVLLNSANKTDEGVGVGFDNMQMESQMDNDTTSITMIGLDEDLGAGSLDLRRLINQYHNGTVVTDYKPGEGLEGFLNSGNPNFPASDSMNYNLVGLGTDPTNAFVSDAMAFLCAAGFGGVMLDENENDFADPWEKSNLEMTITQRFGPFSESVERLLDGEFSKSAPMGRRDDPDLGGGDRQGSGSGGGGPGGRPIPPSDGSDQETIAGTGTRPFRTGWDHGMIGEGMIDLPIGLITPGSGVSVTLTWNRHEVIDLQPFDFANPRANYITFGASGGEDGGSAVDPSQLVEFEYENLDLELWRIELVGGNTRVASSEGVWNNTECVFFEFEGGAFDSDDDGPLGGFPSNYFVRIIYNQTLWDYGGFWFCTGGDMSMPQESLTREDFTDMGRAEVEYGLAWYVDFNISNIEFISLVDRDTGAVNLGIPGYFDNIDRQFITPVGDINVDLIVDANDAAMMIQNFGSTDPLFDINQDGIADALDLEMIALHVGDVAEPRKNNKSEKKAEKQRRKAYKKMIKQRRKDHKKTSKKLK